MIGQIAGLPILPVLLFCFALAVRWLGAKEAVTPFDTYFYLLSTREVRRQSLFLSGALDLPLIPPQKLAVPYLLQWCFSFIPAKTFMRLHPWVGLVADSLFTVGIFHLVGACGFMPDVALIVSMLYLLCPIMFSRVAIGPRVSSFTPRLFSEILANLFYATMFFPLPLPDGQRIAIGVALAAMTLLMSKFGLQVLLFMTPIACAIAGDAKPMIALVGAFAVVVVLTRGRCIEAFVGQIRHLAVYAAKNFRKDTAISNRNSLSQLRTYLDQRKVVSSRLAKIGFFLLSSNSFTAVILKFSAVPVCIILILRQLATGEVVEPWLLAPIVASLIVYLVINIPALLFLGEAERYLTHVGVFFLVAVTQLSLTIGAEWIVTGLIVAGGIYFLAETFLLPRLEREVRARDREASHLVARFADQGRHRRVVLYPYHAIGVWRLAWQTSCEVFYPIALDPEQAATIRPFEGQYPFVAINRLNEMADHFGIDTLIIQTGSPLPRDFQTGSDWVREDTEYTHFTVFTRH